MSEVINDTPPVITSADLILGGFNPRQQQTVLLLAAGKTVDQISAQLNIPRKTIYHWKYQPDFVDAVSELVAQNIDYALCELAHSYTTLLEEVTLIAIDPEANDSDRLRALNMLCSRIESVKADRDKRENRQLLRLLRSEPTNDDDIRRANQKRISQVTAEEVADPKQSKEPNTP